jgi:hypothetical protein
LELSIIHSFGIAKFGSKIGHLNSKFENFVVELNDVLAKAGILLFGLIEGESQV